MGGILSKPKVPAPPKITPPAPMPVPDDKGIANQKKKQAAILQQKTGRQSTVLSDRSVGL